MTITGIGRIGRRKKVRRGDVSGRGLRSILAEGRPEWDLSYGMLGSGVLQYRCTSMGARDKP